MTEREAELMVKAIVVIKKSSGEKSERELTLAVSPRIGETILVPSLGLSPGFEAVVSEIFHKPATRDYPAELYIMVREEEYIPGPPPPPWSP